MSAGERARHVEQLLADSGHGSRVRVAVGRTGIAIGFPRDPMVHVSWWALAAGVVLARVVGSPHGHARGRAALGRRLGTRLARARR